MTVAAVLLWLLGQFFGSSLPSDGANDSIVQAEHTSNVHEDYLATLDELVQKFDLTVFYDDEQEGVYPYMVKWNQPIYFKIMSLQVSVHQRYLEKSVEQLTVLTGLEMHIKRNERNGSPNFLVILTDLYTIKKMLQRAEITSYFGAIKSPAPCFALPWERDGNLIKAIAIVSSDLPQGEIRRCLLEEVTQALGLFADSEVLQPSIFSDGGPITDRLPLNDKILVRTLYDSRIFAGMPRLEALAAAREIMAELLVRLETEGEAALHQRPPRRPKR